MKPKEADPDYIIGIAFGNPAVPTVRRPEEFKRKSLEEIARGVDSRLEAARLAPSGMNGQPWYFIVDGSRVHTYCRTGSGGLFGKMYGFTDLDVGIALCHLAVAGEHEGKEFQFALMKEGAPVPPSGYTYVGTVE